MWTGNLAYNGKAGGQIIVRGEAIQQSNEAFRFTMSVRSLNNTGGGCMGMCQEAIGYRMAAQKMVPGTNNFATVWSSPDMKRTADASFKETTIALSQLCNADKNAQIRFAPISVDT